MPLFDIKKPEETKKPENLYTNIFEKQEEKSTDSSQIISGVFAKQDEAQKAKDKILGPLPEIEKSLIGSFDPEERNLKIVKIIFGSLLGLLLIASAFFYLELNPKFDLISGIRGPNTAQLLENTKNALVNTQTSINKKNYLLTSYYLQKLSYLSDNYVKTRNEPLDSEKIQLLQNDIILTYENALAKFKEPITAGGIEDETFKTQLRGELQNELSQLKKETQTPAIKSAINNHSAALQLLNNKQIDIIFKHNPENIKSDLPRDDAKLFALTQDVLKFMTNEFSTISELKMQRIQWSIIVQEIEKITKSIDTLYGTGFFEELGGIQYSNFDFNSATNRIILTGKAKRDDGNTFTSIVNLIDALENSPVFMNVDNRTYPKTGSEETGYMSSFRIELSLTDDYVLTR